MILADGPDTMSQPPNPARSDPGSPTADPSATTSDGHGTPDGPFDGVTGILGICPLEAASDPLVGCLIGDVEIVAMLAEGGMGRVYEGRQRSPARAVAVKVLRPGFITPEGVRRFAREAEVLGSLRHPNIAQVFWAGACDILGSKVPFIVMELVPGALPITEYARAHGLDTPARLDLFRKVAAAVAHGHAAGIVHRDIKPGNVLIDCSGEPKLIDFGIARLVEASGKATALTELGRLVGTVQYMSPEQVIGDAAIVDRRTDVYALGLLLHELISGRRPYEIDPRRVFDAARVIRERKPVTLAVAEGRRPQPGLAGIIEKCLELMPAARYADASALLVALESPGKPTRRPADSRPIWRRTAASMAAGLLLAAVAAFMAQQFRAAEPPTFTFGFKHVDEPGATEYLVDRTGMRRYAEGQNPPRTYWGPEGNDAEGRLVYRFPFPSPSRRIHLRANSACWDFTTEPGGEGRGASALEVSKDGTTWVALRDGLEPRQWGLDWEYDDDLPVAVVGGTAVWVRLRFFSESAPAEGYAVAQFGRSTILATKDVFELHADLSPLEPRSAGTEALPAAVAAAALQPTPLAIAEVNAATPVDGVLTFVNVSDIPLDVAEAIVKRGQRLRIYDLPEVGSELATILSRNRRGLEIHGGREIKP